MPQNNADENCTTYRVWNIQLSVDLKNGSRVSPSLKSSHKSEAYYCSAIRFHIFCQSVMNNFLMPADRKGGKVLISDGFRCRRKSRTSAKFHWMCTDNAFGARLLANSSDCDRENIVGKYWIFHSFSLESWRELVTMLVIAGLNELLDVDAWGWTLPKKLGSSCYITGLLSY
jgi:hypothetical protein